MKKNAPAHKENGFVYFVEANGKVKIGKTKKPESRIRNIITSSGCIPSECAFEAFETGKHSTVEKLCHDDDRIKLRRIGSTEWFNIDSETAKEVITSHVEDLIDPPANTEKEKELRMSEVPLFGYSKEPEIHLSQAMAKIAHRMAKERGMTGWLMKKVKGNDCSKLELLLSIFFYRDDPLDTYDTLSNLEDMSDESFVEFMIDASNQAENKANELLS